MASSARLQDWRDRRDAPRMAANHAARIEGDCFSCTGNLLNISASGAMIATAFPPRAGRHVTLICDDVDAVGRVVWVGERRLGLAFDAHLRVDQVSRLTAAAC